MQVFDVMITKEFLQQVVANSEEEAFLIAESRLPQDPADYDTTAYKVMDVVDFEGEYYVAK